MAGVADDGGGSPGPSWAIVSDRLQPSATILTAGYGDRGFEGFIELLKSQGVTHFVDVRSVPHSSYWEAFRKPNLERLVPEAGLKYVWMGDTLGGKGPSSSYEDAPETAQFPVGATSPIFCKADPSSIDLAPLFADPKLEIGLQRLKEAMDVPERKLCLVCGCKRPHFCHRSRLVGAALVERGVNVLHINEKGQMMTQEQVAREAAPQPSLF